MGDKPASVDEYLAGKNADGVRLFRRFQSLVEASGPDVEAAPSRTVVYFRRNRVFAGGFVNGRRLEIVVDLLRRAEHPLLLAAFPHTKKVTSHRLRITDESQLDDTIAALLAEAYADVGPGTRGLH